MAGRFVGGARGGRVRSFRAGAGHSILRGDFDMRTRAIRFHDYGGPEALRFEEIEQPTAKEGEILVRVRAASVNPVDWKIRDGLVRKRFSPPLPLIPGGDLSGEVAAVGAGVSGFAVGEAVFAMIGLWGAYAEHAAFKAAMAARKPASIDHAQAASVPLVGLTAWQALHEHGAVRGGQRVLVLAASGGVGGFAVQFARAAGAHVIASASDKNADYVRGLGANEVFDYRTDPAARHAGSIDLIVDTAGGDGSVRSLELLKPDGALVAVAAPSEALKERGAKLERRVLPMQGHPDGAQLAQIASLIDAGKVRTTVAAVFPLAQAAAAQELSKQGHTRGKIVLTS
jgi:NADPH:quinone reductase-like Zn-dependent oxidoreductase